MIMDIYSDQRNRKTIPKSWCGIWVDKNGRQILVESTRDLYSLTFLDNKGNSFKIELLGGNVRRTTELRGSFTKDQYDNPILQVEAGTEGIGPTLNLYFLAINDNGEHRLAKNSDKPEQLILKIDVGMGLYDDWEDDLGVPWIYPLEDYKIVIGK